MHEFTTDILQIRFVDNQDGLRLLKSLFLQDEIQLLMLARKLRQTADYDEAITVLREADAQLDRWQLATSEDDGKTILPFGAVVFSPREFERRG